MNTEKATDDGATDASANGPTVHELHPAGAPGPSAASPGSDQALVERAAKGEHAAFDELVLKHQDRIYAVCLRTLRDAEAARDAAQEAFLKAWKALPRFEGRSKFSTWLHRIAVNVCLSAIRSNKAHPDRRALSLDGGGSGDDDGGGSKIADPAAPPLSPGDGMERNEAREAVTNAIAALDPDFRVAVVLRDIEGKPYEEIAEILQIPVGTVRSRIHRGREQLRSALEGFVASGRAVESHESPSDGPDPPAAES